MYNSSMYQGLKKILHEITTIAESSDPEWVAERRQFFENHVIRTAARMVRIRANQHALLTEAFDEAVAKYWSDITAENITLKPVNIMFTHLVYFLGDNYKDVYVHPNLPLDNPLIVEAYANTHSYNLGMALFEEKLYKEYKESLGTPKEKAWIDQATTWRRIKRTQTMSLERCLRNYTTLPATLPDHIILGIAELIRTALKPVELLFAEKDTDFAEMYAAGGPSSCMVATSGSASGWRDWMLKQGIVPASFYAYHPYTKGAYIKKNGRVVARAILFNIGGKWKYCRIYYSNDGAKRTFIQAMKAHGITECIGDPLSHWRNIKGMLPFTFRVPARKIPNRKNTYFMPVPYNDHARGNCKAVLHTDTEEPYFEVTMYDNEKGNVEMGLTKGYHEDGDGIKCTYCRCTIRENRTSFPMLEGDGVFCSSACVNSYEENGYSYCVAETGEGVFYAVPVNKAFITLDNRTYTNLKAAFTRGARPVTGLRGTEAENPFLYSVRYNAMTINSNSLMLAFENYTEFNKKFMTKAIREQQLLFESVPLTGDVKKQRNARTDLPVVQINGSCSYINEAAERVKVYRSKWSVDEQMVSVADYFLELAA